MRVSMEIIIGTRIKANWQGFHQGVPVYKLGPYVSVFPTTWKESKLNLCCNNVLLKEKKCDTLYDHQLGSFPMKIGKSNLTEQATTPPADTKSSSVWLWDLADDSPPLDCVFFCSFIMRTTICWETTSKCLHMAIISALIDLNWFFVCLNWLFVFFKRIKPLLALSKSSTLFCRCSKDLKALDTTCNNSH